MVDKHLIHLRQMVQLTEIPRALGLPEDRIQMTLMSAMDQSRTEGTTNPFAERESCAALAGQLSPLNHSPPRSVGITDLEYRQMLEGMSNGTGLVPNTTLTPEPMEHQRQLVR